MQNKKTMCRLLLLLLFSFLISVNAMDYYAEKPPWWDSVKIEIAKDKSIKETYVKSLNKNIAERTKLEDWYYIGPFDNYWGQAFEHIYPPEKKVDLTAHYRGKGNTIISWQLWSAGKNIVLNQIPSNMVVFFYKELNSENPCKKYLSFTSDDGAAIWFNGRNVYLYKANRGMNHENPDIIELELWKGKNEILAKVDQGTGPWGMSAWLSEQNPAYYKIRLCTEILKLFPDGGNEHFELAKQLCESYKQIRDYPNIFFWTKYLIDNKTDLSYTKGMIRELFNRCQDTEAEGIAKDFFRNIFNSKQIDNEHRSLAVCYLLELMLNREEFNDILTFVDKYRFSLKELMPVQAMFYKLKVFIQKGDYERAYETLKEIKNIKDIENNAEFKFLNAAVEGMKSAAAQITLDWDFDLIVNQASKLYANNNYVKLNNFIRNTLMRKNNAFLDSKEDSCLFAGSLQKYKSAFEKYSKLYNPSLIAYSKLLEGKLEYSKSQLDREITLLSLEPSKSSSDNDSTIPEKLSISEISMPKEKNLTFQPLINMVQGNMEFLTEITGNRFFRNNRIIKSSPGFLCLNDDLSFLQNSRQMLCLKNKKVVWSRILDNSLIKSASGIIPGPFLPKSNGSMVFARMLNEGKFDLLAFDCKTGEIIWGLLQKEKDYVVCTNPVLGQQQLMVIAKKSEVVSSSYYLLYINPSSGKIEDELFLFSAQDSVPVNNHYIQSVQFDLFMPDPVIESGQAFISTNYGVFFCVDIAGNSVVWARKYPRIPFSVSEKLSSKIQKRCICPPVIGKKNILFAPLDSSALLLVDKRSGRLTSENTGVDWVDVRALGKNSAIVIGEKIKSFSVSLDNLKSTTTLGKMNYSYIASLEDGIILFSDNILEVKSEDGKTRIQKDLPSDFIPLSIGQNKGRLLREGTLLGYQNNSQLPAVGMLVSKTQKNKNPVFSSVEKDINYLENPRFKKNGNDIYLLADNYILRLSEQFIPLWAFPLNGGNIDLLQNNKNIVFIISNNYVMALDKNNGELKKQYPGLGDKISDLSAPCLSSNGELIFAGKAIDEYNSNIITLSSENVAIKGNIEKPCIAAIQKNGDHILVIEDRSAEFYEFNPTSSSYMKTDKTIKLDKRRHEYVIVRVNDSGKIVLLHLAHILIVSDFSFIPLRSKDWPRGYYNMWWYAQDNIRTFSDLVCCRLYNFPVWTLLDTKYNTDLSAYIPSACLPSVKNNIVTGVTIEKNIATVYDRKSKKILNEESVDFNSPLFGRRGTYCEFSMLWDKKVFHMFRPQWQKEISEEGVLFIQDLRKKGIQLKSFPGYNRCSEAIADKEHVGMLIDNKLVTFRKDEFLKLTDKTADIFEVPYRKKNENAFNCRIDGYPDEWDIENFYASGCCSFYAVLDEDHLFFAGIIRDEEIIKRIGLKGLDDRFSFLMMPGSTACLRTDNFESAGLAGAFGENTRREWEFDFSVSPSADFCFFEMRIPNRLIFHFYNSNAPNIGSVITRDLRGDMAFNFIFKSKPDEEINLFSQETKLPVYYPRLKFVEKK